MKSVKNILMAITLGSTIVLAGCGVQKSEQATSGSNTQTAVVEKQSPSEEKKSLSVEDGSKNMRDILKDIKAQLLNKEEDEAVKVSDKLEQNWSAFEDTVKEKNPALYEKVEVPLGVIQAGVKVKPIDTKTIITAIETLDKVLTEIQNIK